MSILSEARQLSKELHQGEDWRENSHYYLEKCDKLLPELLAYAERREMQVIEERVDKLSQRDDGFTFEGKSVDVYEQAAQELSADLSSWHKITEEEREAIQDAILCFKAHERDEKETIEVLRGMIK